MPSASLFAKLILAIADEELTSNLQLQKLLYYSQGFHLAMYKSPLFREEVRAWTHGPAVPTVWDEYEHHESNAIPPSWVDLDAFTKRESDLVKDVYCVYGQFAEWKLRKMVQRTAPFTRTRPGEVITHRKMTDYFVDQLDEDPDETPSA